jgi:hypothetical protein
MNGQVRGVKEVLGEVMSLCGRQKDLWGGNYALFRLNVRDDRIPPLLIIFPDGIKNVNDSATCNRPTGVRGV